MGKAVTHLSAIIFEMKLSSVTGGARSPDKLPDGSTSPVELCDTADGVAGSLLGPPVAFGLGLNIVTE